MKSLSLSTKLVLLLSLFAGGFLCLAAAGWMTLARVRVNGPIYDTIILKKDLIADILPPPEHILEPYVLVLQMEREADPARLNKIVEKIRALRREFHKRHDFWTMRLDEGPLKRKLLEDSNGPAITFFEVTENEVIPAVLSGDRAKASEIIRSKLARHFEAHQQAVNVVVSMANEVFQNEERRAAEVVARNTRILAGIAVCIAGVVLFIGWRFSRYLTRLVERVRQAAIELIATANQIGATSRQQESTVQGFGASTSEIAAAVKQISATSQELLGTMNAVSGVASEAASLAEHGRSGLEGMDKTMRQLSSATASISSKLAVIREKANHINVVVTTISKVADQTNLLSVNAAIEAEKAGEFGLGFLVLAREIRRLADQTAVATLDIDRMVREMQAAVSAGVMEMDKFSEEVRRGVDSVGQIGGQLGRIIEQVGTLNARFDSVNEGMRSQSQGAAQIDQAMVQLTDGARQSAGSLKEFNGATEHLRGAVNGLREEISRFDATA